MSLSIRFTVFGKCIGKERKAGPGRYQYEKLSYACRIYVPKRVKDYEKKVRGQAIETVNNKLAWTAEYKTVKGRLEVMHMKEALDIDIAIVEIWPYSKTRVHGDGDRVLNCVEDALSKICYKDDRHIAGKHNLWTTGEDKLIVQVSWPEREE